MTRSRDTFKSPSGRFQSVVITSGDGKKQGPSSFAVWPTRWSRGEGEKTRSGPGDDDCFSRAKLGSSAESSSSRLTLFFSDEKRSKRRHEFQPLPWIAEGPWTCLLISFFDSTPLQHTIDAIQKIVFAIEMQPTNAMN